MYSYLRVNLWAPGSYPASTPLPNIMHQQLGSLGSFLLPLASISCSCSWGLGQHSKKGPGCQACLHSGGPGSLGWMYIGGQGWAAHTKCERKVPGCPHCRWVMWMGQEGSAVCAAGRSQAAYAVGGMGCLSGWEGRRARLPTRGTRGVQHWAAHAVGKSRGGVAVCTASDFGLQLVKCVAPDCLKVEQPWLTLYTRRHLWKDFFLGWSKVVTILGSKYAYPSF